MRCPLGRLLEGRLVAAVVENTRREWAMWFRIAMLPRRAPSGRGARGSEDGCLYAGEVLFVVVPG
jgi:hypothetical protein